MSTEGFYSWIGFLDKLNLSGRMYNSLEDDFARFLEFVPLAEQNLTVFSPKLFNLILNVGPEVLSIFDLLAFTSRYRDHPVDKERFSLLEKKNKLRKRKRSLTFLDYFNFLGKIHDFEKGEVVVKELHRSISPFLTKDNRIPEWWDCYNRLKHDKYSHFKEATLKIALHGLGATYYLIQYGHDWEGREDFKSRVFERHVPRSRNLSEVF